MLALLGSAALVLVAGAPWVLPAASGGEDLEPPGGTDVYIIDDNFTLKWSSNEEPVNNVTFSAEYQTEEMENWLKLPECQHITGTECEFSLPDADVYIRMKFRVRAEKGKHTSSWNEVEPFIPFPRAHIGPPGVRLEAEDKAILVHISQPRGKMWASDSFNFRYQIVLWQKSSGATQNVTTNYCIEKILKLLPETTYCLKVEAIHLYLRKQSKFSEVQCINTTEANRLPVPENVEVDAQGQSYVLRWDYSSPNVSFSAQWLPHYLKRIPEGYSNKWRSVSTCTNVQTPHCVFPQNTIYTDTFFLRVQASEGNKTSFWSEEKFIDSQKYTVIPPPTISVTLTGESLLVDVSCQDNSSIKCQRLTYEIIFWEISSNTKRKMVQKSPKFTIMNLQPLTVYCVEARVHAFAPWNKSSNFSGQMCEKTRAGNSPVIWAMTGLGILCFSALVFYAGRSLLKDLSHVFSSPKPPPSIHELFSDPPSKNLLLLTPEEHTERCFIIESANLVTVAEENHAPEEDHRKYSSQTSQDSGNYSNEEESAGSESSQGLRP